MSPSTFPSGASPEGLHPHDLPPEFSRGAPVVVVFLDRSGVCSCENIAQYPHHSDDHDSEQRPVEVDASWIIHQSHRRLDGHVSRFRLRCVHRVFDREHDRPSTESAFNQVGDVGRCAASGGRHGAADGRNPHGRMATIPGYMFCSTISTADSEFGWL